MRVERRVSLAPRGARHSGGDRQMGHERKLKRRDKCYKTVQNARGDANCARAQEGGGRGETLVLLSVLSSRAMRAHTARFGSPRRRCSFLAAAAPAQSQNVQIRRSSSVKKVGHSGLPALFESPKETGVAVSKRCQTTQTSGDGVLLELLPTIWRGS